VVNADHQRNPQGDSMLGERGNGRGRAWYRTGDDTVRIVHSTRVSGRVVARARVAARPGDPGSGDRTDQPAGRLRRQLRHDMRHELATIMLLGSLLESAPELGPDSRKRCRQLLAEAHRLEELQRAYEESFQEQPDPGRFAPDPVQLDVVAREVVDASCLSTPTTISLRAGAAWAYVDRLASWRALRNMIGNAVRAAGPAGRVDVRVESLDGWAIVQVDDDGPGFGSGASGTDSLGLEIVRGFADRWSGRLEIRRSELGGCQVRLRMRAAPAAPSCGPWGVFGAVADL
jgi:signal transduction histidine kinase